MFAQRAEIEASLELAAAGCEDLTPLVYPRLFARLPATEALFVRDTTGAIKGEMLAKVFEAILDYVGERRYAQHLIGSEAVTHSYYDVPQDQFPVFFEVVAETVQAVLADAWTPAFDAAWARLIHELRLYVANGSGAASEVAATL